MSPSRALSNASRSSARRLAFSPSSRSVSTTRSRASGGSARRWRRARRRSAGSGTRTERAGMGCGPGVPGDAPGAAAPDPIEGGVTSGDVLGWKAFQELLARFAATPFGRDRAGALLPSRERPAIEAGLAETGEARRALTAEGVPPWEGITDIRPALERALPEGALLDGPSLVAVGRTLASVERLAGYGRRIAALAPGLTRQCGDLPA